MKKQTIKETRLGWRTFVAASVLCVASVFGIVFILERTVFEDAPLQSLRYLYVILGVSASFLVMALAGLFFETRHRLTEMEMRKFLRAVEQAPHTVMITDSAGNIEYVNPRFTQLTGYHRKEVIGKNPRILKSGQTPPQVHKRLWETIAAGRDWRGEVINKKKEGEVYWEALSISPITNGKGQITHFVGVLEDITERKRMERLKDEFVGTVSHELRTPVALIKWSVGNLKDGLAGPLTKEQRGLLEGISRHCSRLERVVSETLDLSRLESGRAKINRRPVNLITLLQESIQNLQETARRSGIALEEEIPSDLPDLDADPDMVLQLLDNLLENAIRFAKKKVVVRAKGSHDAVQVSVIDDGPGVAEEDRERLFSKFEQLSRPSEKKGYKGTGLGLAIAREIIGHHRGKIWIGGEVGKGAEFHFTLPIKTREVL